MSQILNIATYRFVGIDDPAALKATWLPKAKALGLKGTILLAHEGINLFLAGAETAIRSFMAFSTLTTPERVQHGGPREQFKDWIGSLEPRAQDAGYLTAQALIAKGRAMRAQGPDGKLHLLAIAGDRSTNSSIQRRLPTR